MVGVAGKEKVGGEVNFELEDHIHELELPHGWVERQREVISPVG